MLHIKNKKKNGKSGMRETNTLDNKYRQMVKQINSVKNEKENILNEINSIKNEILMFDSEKTNITAKDSHIRAQLLDKKAELESTYDIIRNNYDEMEYYDIVGDLVVNYFEVRDIKESETKETKNILDFLCNKKEKKQPVESKNNRAGYFEKYCQRIEGIRINKDDGSNRIKYCKTCEIEKILDMTASAYICDSCGDFEIIILDEDRQIKDYSPYKRLNHFREWLNQFQAKQSPEIPEPVFSDIVKELNKIRTVDLSTLTKKRMKRILKKLGYNSFYEHAAYIINKLNNLPPPKITKDMEKIFISMFIEIQEPWELFKQPGRKNFMSYSFVLRKFCELRDLDHLLKCFPLHKDTDIVMENDQIWEKICRYRNWEYIPAL